MARSKTAQPKHSLRKIAVVVATAVSGMSVYAQAAVEPKEDTITVTAAPAPQESAWGPAATIAARQSATGTKTDTPIQKVPQSISVVTAEEMALHQPKSVKEALSYTPGVSVGTRGASNTYDHLIIRGFAAEGQSQNNYLNGLKLQGNFYNDAVIDPYMLERAEIMRGPVSVLYGKSSPGGLLNMVSKRPTTEPLKEVQFKAGTDSLFQTGFDFSDSLDDDGVYSYRLTGLARSANAQQKGSEEQRYAIAPAFTWRPDDKTNFTFLSYFQNEPETGYYGWLPKEGTVEPLPNGKRLPTDFNEGAKNNTYSRNEKMVGYSFDHEFNDTFTVRQNLRFAENKTSQNSVYGYGVCSGGLQHLAEFHRVYVPHVPALSSLDRHGDPTPSLHRFHNASRFVRILHQCAAVSAVGHLGHGTAHIDVDDVRLFQLHDLGRRLLHAHHIAAEQLDGGGVLIRRQRHDAAGLFVLIA